MKQILDHCNFLLNNINNPAKEYLSSRCTENYFKFGYFPENLSLLKDYFEESYLKELKLIRTQETNNSIKLISYFQDYELIIGFNDLYGNLIALVARCLKDHNLLNIPKYKNTKYKKTNHLFGLYESLNQIKELDYVIIVEGQFDVIKAFDNNIQNIVAVGCSNISENQFLLLKRFTNNIYTCLDNDKAGIEGTNSFIKKYNNYANIKKINLPEEYKDLDEFLQFNSKNDLLRFIT
jgi:DNA primase